MGWSHSPLAQVTRDNVKDLQLAWVWAMNEGGANEPMPLVHNGIIYLATTGNILQGLDGRTGELIWENHMVFQNVFESIDPKTGAPQYRGDILEQQAGQWVQ